MAARVGVADKRGRSRRRGKDGERGAVAIEFALIVPLVVVLLFGIIDFGFTFSNWLAVRDGSRDGARQAVVGEVSGDSSCPTVGAGMMTVTTKEAICLTKGSVGLDETETRVKIVVDAYVEGDILAVCVQYPADSFTGFFSPLLDDKTVNSKVQMRIEDLTDPSLHSVQETPHAGSDWSWCTL